ncbi:MAG: hypothetical protein HYW85_04070 [Deltaproteobacteria bacterium]|nr:hypothetical protein [Deltaproteobacteria bacterium]MBI3016755.1 hypothetical protein [Deltaproteobacteria bacterium]
MKKGWLKKFTAILSAYFSIALSLSWAADSNNIYVQTKLKNAVLRLEENMGPLRNALQLSQIKKTFTILLDVPADKLSLFIHEKILEEAIEQVRSELGIPLQKQRLEIIAQLLRTAKDHPMISKAFSSYKESTRALYRRDSEAGLQYAIGRGSERLAAQSSQEIFGLIRDLLDTQEVLLDPMQIFRMAAKRGFKIVPTQNIVEWHRVLFEIEPKLFLIDDEINQEFFYSWTTRRLFSNPDYLYQYLHLKPPAELSNPAQEFLKAYEKNVPLEARHAELSPRQWAYIYDELGQSHPHLLSGIFSLPENKIFFEFYRVLTQLSQNHVFYCSDLISQTLKDHPAELMAALRFILRKQGGFLPSEIQNATPQIFMAWLTEGRLPYLQYAMKKLKIAQQVLQSLEQHLLKSNKPLSSDTLLWAEHAVDKSLEHLDSMWEDIGLPLKNIDSIHLEGGLTVENLERIMLTRNLIGKLFGEEYMVALRALKTHIRKVQIR